jgi:hypothetical protein
MRQRKDKKAYEPMSPVQRLQLRFRRWMMWIGGPSVVAIGGYRLARIWLGF